MKLNSKQQTEHSITTYVH